MNQKFLDPYEWRKLEPKKKLNMFCRLFFVKCSETNMFVNKKISPDFLKVRSFFRKQEVNLLYDYMWTIERTPMNITTLFQKAEQWNTEQKFKHDQQPTVDKYENMLDLLMEE